MVPGTEQLNGVGVSNLGVLDPKSNGGLGNVKVVAADPTSVLAERSVLAGVSSVPDSSLVMLRVVLVDIS